MVFTNKDLNKNTYTLGEVANFLSIHLKTLQKKDREGLIPFDRTSTNRRFLTRENLIKLMGYKILTELELEEIIEEE